MPPADISSQPVAEGNGAITDVVAVNANGKDAASNGIANGAAGNGVNDANGVAVENGAVGDDAPALAQREKRARKGGKSGTANGAANGDANGSADGDEKKTRTFYLVRLPRPEEDVAASAKYEAELELHKQRFEYITAALRVKRVTKSAARAETEATREVLQARTAEVRAKMDELKPMRDQLQRQRDAGDSLKSLKGELTVTSEEELDRRVQEIEYRISHEVMPIAEEKTLVRQIKLLKMSREKIVEYESRMTSVNEGKLESDGLRAHLKGMSAEVDILRAQEDAARQEFLKYKEVEKAIDDEINAILAEREEAKAEKDACYESLKEARGGKAKEDREWYKSRKLIRQVRDLAEKGEMEAAQELCDAQVERMHEKLADKEFREEYIRLLEKQNPTRMRGGSEEIVEGGAPAAARPVASIVSEVQAQLKDILSVSLDQLMEERARETRPEPESPEPEPEVYEAAPEVAVVEKPVVAPKPVKKFVVEMPVLPEYELEIPVFEKEKVDVARVKQDMKQEELRKQQEAEDRKRRQAAKAAQRKQVAEAKAQQAAEDKAARKEAIARGEIPAQQPKKAAAAAPAAPARVAAAPQPKKAAPSTQATVPAPPALKRRVKGNKFKVIGDTSATPVEKVQEWFSVQTNQLMLITVTMMLIMLWLLSGSK